MNGHNKEKYAVYTLFLVLFIMRLVNITSPPLDYSSWRQVDTDSIARNFVEYKFNIFYPQLNYDGPMPNYVQLELQVTTIIIAILYKLFGFTAASGRLVAVVFFIGSCYYLYRLVKKRSGAQAAIMAATFYGMLPINVVYSRNIMPESALVFFSNGALYYFHKWIEEEGLKSYALTCLFTALAVLTKIPAALIGIPMIYLSLKKWGLGAFRNIKLYMFAVFSLGAPYIYYRWLGTVAEQKFVNGIGGTIILPNFFSAILKAENINYLAGQFTMKVFTIPGIVFFLIGALSKMHKEDYFYWVWLLAAVLHVILIDAAIHLDYYLMFITPIISVFMGFGGMVLVRMRKLSILLFAGLLMIVIYTAGFMKMVYNVNERYISIGNDVSQHTEKDALIIIDKDSPELFYTCDRKGWRLHGALLTVENIKKLIDEGADYFVPYSLDDEGQWMRYLDENYARVTFKDGYYIYKLSR